MAVRRMKKNEVAKVVYTELVQSYAERCAA